MVFLTTKVAEICPEWWGATAGPYETDFGLPVDDTQALKDCLVAAHTDRTFPGWNFPSLPVILRGNYTTSAELVVEPKDLPRNVDGTIVSDPALIAAFKRQWSGVPSNNGLILQGRRGTGTANVGVAALTASPTFPLRAESELATLATGRAILRLIPSPGQFCRFDDSVA